MVCIGLAKKFVRVFPTMLQKNLNELWPTHYNSDKLEINVQWYEGSLLYDKLDVSLLLINMKTMLK